MLQIIRNKFTRYYYLITTSIAFYPTIISLTMFLLGMFLLTQLDGELSSYLDENAPFFVIDDATTARAILTTLIGGVISLLVFSFSTVMLVLNQVNSNFSPRLLPSLISDKRNQFVVGVYLGTIIFNILVLLTILPDGENYQLRSFAILVGIILGIFCLALFVYFIEGMSSRIQVDNILKDIYTTTKKRLLDLLEKENGSIDDFNSVDGWKEVKGATTGYYESVNINILKEIADEVGGSFKVIPFNGQYLLKGVPVLLSEKELTEEQEERVISSFMFNVNEDATKNYIFGIKKMTEIGLKAMSPGINDPGTALSTLDYLAELISIRMLLNDNEVLETEGGFKINNSVISFEDVMYNVFVAYRQYCRHDVILMQKIILLLQYLMKSETTQTNYYQVIKSELNNCVADIDAYIKNPVDRKKLMELLDLR